MPKSTKIKQGKFKLPWKCRNPSLGFATKARACKGVGQQWGSWVTIHAPENVGECEGMNPHSQVGSHFGN
jgi:hypothetical protein